MKFRILRRMFLPLLLISSLLFSAVPAFAAAPAVTEIDYHRYSQLLVDVCGRRCVDEAIEVIDAYFAGESSVTFDDTYETGDISVIQSLLGTMCPVFEGTTFSGWDCFDEDTRTYTWENLCTPDEADALKQEFEDVCMGYLDDLEAGDSDLVKYLTLYYDFTSEREYNYDLQDELDAAETSQDQAYISSALRCMIEYKGKCAALSRCWAFLCLQAGLNACTVSSRDPDFAHDWDVIELDGSYYYCDPTWDLPDGENTSGLMNFGLTAEERAIDGCELEDAEFLVSGSLITPASLGLDNDRFYKLHGWTYNCLISFTVDHEKNTITVTNRDGLTNTIQ